MELNPIFENQGPGRAGTISLAIYILVGPQGWPTTAGPVASHVEKTRNGICLAQRAKVLLPTGWVKT